MGYAAAGVTPIEIIVRSELMAAAGLIKPLF
jgi:hypothetical protein